MAFFFRCAAPLLFAVLAANMNCEEAVCQPIDFNREIRPILSEYCLRCHGPDAEAREAGLRLDQRHSALSELGSGAVAIVPGNIQQSELARRITSEDDGVRMPPPELGKRPTSEEIALVVKWIDQGAVWAEHWAFVTPERPPLPEVNSSQWKRNPIDRFILARLEKERLSPSPEADKATLLRRVSLDLTGLPPTIEELNAFMSDDSADAYDKVVDRLLASPHYGERMAVPWLDVARYADSDGYHDDTPRVIYQFRDYVLEAFNSNKPFDQFTVEQLAGDLLPNATLEQKIASAFHRLGPTTSEVGADANEYLAKYAVDRVNTTATAWLGLTLNCAECHDHKYDPFTTKEFYSLFAFFNQVPEQALYRGSNAPPTIRTPNREQQARLAQFEAEIEALSNQAKTALEMVDDEQAQKLSGQIAAKLKEREEYEKSIPEIRVMADVPERRPTRILVRGDYRNFGKEVQPGVPAILGSLSTDTPPNRLALARWLVDPNHPLTARVAVNRFWQMVFGTGLVKTTEDFGVRGERPSHPELLNWLACEFIESGWDVKHLMRLIVTSSAYRQSSRISPELLSRDPENRLLARGARFRLSAELVRDNALAISGLLNRQIGGPSVKPYQPGDLWREFAYGDDPNKTYVQDHGPELYRRGMYTFWKRSVLYPALMTFDAPKREVCTVQRSTTNTPLQALVTLNDVTYVEAARVFAQRLIQESVADPNARIEFAFKVALSRPPSAEELEVMRSLFDDTCNAYRDDAAAAEALISIGEFPGANSDFPEHAAWTCVCNAILNLDETLTKE
jgi:hypothetical protein